MWTVAPAALNSSAAGALRAEHVRLEARAEVRDQLREARRGAAELRPVVDVENRNPVARRCDLPVDPFDAPRVEGGVEVRLRVGARRASEAGAALRIAEQLRDRVRERVDAEVVDEDACLAGDDDAAAGPRAGRDDRDAARRGLDHRPPELGPPRRRHDDVARLVQVRGVLRERDEADVVRKPELLHQALRLRLVVPRQVCELQPAADDGLEELLAADGAADDEVARVEAAVAQPGAASMNSRKPFDG